MTGFNYDNNHNNRKRKKQVGTTGTIQTQKLGGDSATQHYSQAQAKSFNALKDTLNPKAPQMQWQNVDSLGSVNEIIKNLVAMKNARLQQDYDRQRGQNALQFISRLSADINNQKRLAQQQEQNEMANRFKEAGIALDAIQIDNQANINEQKKEQESANRQQRRMASMSDFDNIINSINPDFEKLSEEQKQELRRRYLNTGSSDFDVRVAKKGIFFDDYEAVYPEQNYNEQNATKPLVVPARPAMAQEPQAPEQIPEVNIDGDLSDEVLDKIAKKYTELGIKKVKINGNIYRID